MKKSILIRINAIIAAVLALLGFSAQSCVEYGVYLPEEPVWEDSTRVDTTIHCMYGVFYTEFDASNTNTDASADIPENQE